MLSSPQRHQEHEVAQRLERENQVSAVVVDCVFKVHKVMGSGLLESAYEECLAKEFLKRKVSYKKQHEMPLYYDDELLETPYRLDFLVEDCLILELKSVERLLPVHQSQILTYLKLSNLKLGLLVNFNVPLIKDGIKRFVL